MVFIDEVSTDNIGVKGVTVSDQRAKAGRGGGDWIGH